MQGINTHAAALLYQSSFIALPLPLQFQVIPCAFLSPDIQLTDIDPLHPPSRRWHPSPLFTSSRVTPSISSSPPWRFIRNIQTSFHGTQDLQGSQNCFASLVLFDSSSFGDCFLLQSSKVLFWEWRRRWMRDCWRVVWRCFGHCRWR